ncbi:MAG: hypothetical protein AAGD23_10010 [Pseudomonadota bacterium]
MTHSTEFHSQPSTTREDVLTLLRMLQYIELELEEHDPLTQQIVAMAVRSLSDHCELRGKVRRQH